MIARRLRSPVRVDLVLNADCNHKCVHCYNPWREEISACNNLKGHVFREKMDQVVQELISADVWSVILTGGEPLLHPQELLYAIDVLRANRISMCLNTNLTQMNDKLAQSMVKEHGWSNMVLTSLPSIDEERCDNITCVKGSFRSILNGIDTCVRNGISVGVNTVITKRNLLDLPHYANFVREHLIDYLSISIVIPPVYDSANDDYYLTSDDIRTIAETLVNVKETCDIEIGSVTPLPLCLLLDADKYISILNTACLAGISKCSIHLVDGRVTACAHEECSYGNIYKDGLAYCWSNMSEWSIGSQLAKECQDCKWLYLCGGECRMMRRPCYKKPAYQLNPQAEITFKKNAKATAEPLPANDKLLQISPMLRVRKEEFGYLLKAGFVETRVSSTLWNLCEALRQKKCFTVLDIWTIIEETELSRTIIRTLMTHMIIERVN